MYLVSLGNGKGGVARIPVLILMRETNLLVELASIGFQKDRYIYHDCENNAADTQCLVPLDLGLLLSKCLFKQVNRIERHSPATLISCTSGPFISGSEDFHYHSYAKASHIPSFRLQPLLRLS
jgi:hypothetical protein